MRVYLCRHALALSGEPDELRELSAEGLEQARALGESLAARDEAPHVILSSPLLRARQTAAEIGYSLGFKDPAYFARFFKRATGLSPTTYRTSGGVNA